MASNRESGDREDNGRQNDEKYSSASGLVAEQQGTSQKDAASKLDDIVDRISALGRSLADFDEIIIKLDDISKSTSHATDTVSQSSGTVRGHSPTLATQFEMNRAVKREIRK